MTTHPDAARLLALLNRGRATLASEVDAAGNLRPLDRWPRAKRREFARVSAKVERIKARAEAVQS